MLDWARQEAQNLVGGRCDLARQHMQRALADALRAGRKPKTQPGADPAALICMMPNARPRRSQTLSRSNGAYFFFRVEVIFTGAAPSSAFRANSLARFAILRPTLNLSTLS